MSLSVGSDGTKEVTPVKNVVAEEHSLETRGFWLVTWMLWLVQRHSSVNGHYLFFAMTVYWLFYLF